MKIIPSFWYMRRRRRRLCRPSWVLRPIMEIIILDLLFMASRSYWINYLICVHIFGLLRRLTYPLCRMIMRCTDAARPDTINDSNNIPIALFCLFIAFQIRGQQSTDDWRFHTSIFEYVAAVSINVFFFFLFLRRFQFTWENNKNSRRTVISRASNTKTLISMQLLGHAVYRQFSTIDFITARWHRTLKIANRIQTVSAILVLFSFRLKNVLLPSLALCYGCFARSGLSTIDDLLSKPILRYSAWGMAMITCLGNSLVLWGRFTQRDENRAVSMVIRNLAVSDMLMGFYLLILGVQDYRFRMHYGRVAFEWAASWMCIGVGVLAMISSEVSLLILTFISIERFLLIADPFGGHRRLTTQNVMLCMFTIWLIGITIAIVPGTHLWHFRIGISSGQSDVFSLLPFSRFYCAGLVYFDCVCGV